MTSKNDYDKESYYSITELCTDARLLGDLTLIAGLHAAGLHDHFNRRRLSIEAFFQPIFSLFFHFESFLITFDWLEKSFDRKPAPIEVIM